MYGLTSSKAVTENAMDVERPGGPPFDCYTGLKLESQLPHVRFQAASNACPLWELAPCFWVLHTLRRIRLESRDWLLDRMTGLESYVRQISYTSGAHYPQIRDFSAQRTDQFTAQSKSKTPAQGNNTSREFSHQSAISAISCPPPTLA